MKEGEKTVVYTSEVSVSLEGKAILENISMKVNAGEAAGIIGPNGAGKTTLLRLLLGMLRPDGGAIEIYGSNPCRMGNKRDKVGYMPQCLDVSPEIQLSVLDVVSMGLFTPRLMGRPWRLAYRSKARESLKEVEMDEHRNQPFHCLSAGQKRRVFLARALSRGPGLLLLDEPNTGLDLPTRHRFMDLLKKLQEERGLTVVMVSHDLAAVATHMEWLYCINRTMHLHGRPSEVLQSPRLGEAYSCELGMLAGYSVMERRRVK